MSDLMEQILMLLGDERRVAVILSPDSPGPSVEALHGSDRTVTTCLYSGQVTALHDDLSGRGHFDAIVDIARGQDAHRRMAMLVTHLRLGGLLVIAAPERDPGRQHFFDRLESAESLRGGGVIPPSLKRDTRSGSERDAHAFAAGSTKVRATDDLICLRSAVDTWAVVPENRFDQLLAGNARLGHVVTSVAPAFHATTATVMSSSADESRLPGHDAPKLSIRSFDDVVVSERMIARSRDVILPQAFRNTEQLRPRTPALVEWSKWSVRVPSEPAEEVHEPAVLRGTWFHADNFLRGHFGHAITEQLSLFWAWPEIVRQYPDVGVLVSATRKPLAGWEYDLLGAAGVEPDRIFGAERPVRVERLITATPGYVILRHIHPHLRDLYQVVGDRLERQSTLIDSPARIFVTRPGQRQCHQDPEIQHMFRSRGFEIVSPETYSLSDQVAMSRRAEVVAGYGGSGMFHLLFGGVSKRVIAISHTNYHLWNEKAICSLWDYPLTLIRGTPDVTTEAFSQAAMHSDYTVDLSCEGKVLEQALDALQQH